MNGGAFNIRNRGGGAYNPDCDEHVEKMMQLEEDIDQSGRVIGPRAREVAESKFKKSGNSLRYLWCIIFHTRQHVRMGADVGFGVYCRQCDVKW